MASAFDKIVKVNGAKVETPLAIRQVESHLVFGPLSRQFPCAYLAIAIILASVIISLFTVNAGPFQRIGDAIGTLLWLIVPVIMFKMTLRQQAIIGWMAVKFTLGFAAFMLMTLGSAESFRDGKSDAVPNLLLGLIWIPSLEFVPRITPHQKYVTLARIVLSIPCVYFGVTSGNWHM